MESLFRRDVYLDMMTRQIYLAFHVWVKIDKNDVKAEQDGRVLFNCNEVIKKLGVSLDEFKKRIIEVGLIYKYVRPKTDEEKIVEKEWQKMPKA